MYLNRRLAGILLGASVVLACSEEKLPTRPETSVSPSEAPPGGAHAVWTIDDEFERVARDEVPGFGGFYFDENHKPVVLLVDTTQRAAAEQYVADFQSQRGESPEPVTIREADFDFAQLKAWRDEVLPVLVERDGVLALDIDESANRLNIGVVDAGTVEWLGEELGSLQIPSNALHIEVQPPPRARLSLEDRSRPVKTGFKIQQVEWDGTDFHCSLGFVAVRQVLADTVFVTCSHCSRVPFMMNGDSIWQDTVSTDPLYNFIGHEVWDTATQWECREGLKKHCRWSDASLFTFSAENVTYQYARITRTTGLGSLTVDPYNPYWEIKDKEYYLVEGDTVNKVGSETGWTRGTIEDTCVDHQGAAGYWIACSNDAELYSTNGDSGSPIFTTFELWGDTVAGLAGLLWGGPEGNPYETWYSPIHNIEVDLGKYLKVCEVGTYKYCFH